MRKGWIASAVVVIVAMGLVSATMAQGSAPGGAPVFEIKVPDDFAGELNGRALLILARDVSARQPYNQLGVAGVPCSARPCTV